MMMKVLEYNELKGTYRIFYSNSAVKKAAFEHVGLLTPEKMSEFEKMFMVILAFSEKPPTLERVQSAFWRFERH